MKTNKFSGKKSRELAGCRAAALLAVKLLVFITPIIAVIGMYVIDDPFRVIRKYDDFDSDVILNESYTGWQIYKNAKNGERFNSFLLGNSCTMAYPCREWEKHLSPGDRAVRLFGNAETMLALLMKLEALERDGAEIKNVLMILDSESLKMTGLFSDFLNILPPEVSGKSMMEVQCGFLQGFIMPDFLFPYVKYKLTGKMPVSAGYFNPYGKVRDSSNNDCINPRDRMIEEEGEVYWEIRSGEFPAREGHPKWAEKEIYGPQTDLLMKISEILRRNSTSFKIIISPDFNQVSLNPEDKKTLETIFGKENVHDFSGENEYTADYHNYYEHIHYRPQLGIRLMEEIYRNL